MTQAITRSMGSTVTGNDRARLLFWGAGLAFSVLVSAALYASAVRTVEEDARLVGRGVSRLLDRRLQSALLAAGLPAIVTEGTNFGRRATGAGRAVNVEFVSANPTGPLHVGHGRQAALGDAIAALLEWNGWKVSREFYYNDAGVQIATLATSVKARIDGLKPGDPGWPESAYNGDYVADIAADFLAKKTVRADDREFTASGRKDDLDGIRQFAVAYLRHEQDLDLRAFGVGFEPAKITIAEVLKDESKRDMDAIKNIGTACMDSEDFREGRIAFTAPLAKALIGGEVGEEVEAPGPGGPITILGIKPIS